MRRVVAAAGVGVAVLAAAVLPAQAADESGKTDTVGCWKNRTQALHRALMKSAPIG